MLRKLAKYLLSEIIPVLEEIEKKTDSLVKRDVSSIELAGNLLKHRLGSISAADIKSIEEYSEEELESRDAAIAAVYEKNIAPIIGKMVRAQEDFIATKSSDMDSLMFGRGTINGLFLIEEELKEAVGRERQRAIDRQSIREPRESQKDNEERSA